MKVYIFNLKERFEEVSSPSRMVKADLDEIIKFDNAVGISRNWKKLDRHNEIQKVKRLLIPDDCFMFTKFIYEPSEIPVFNLYIDIGNYVKIEKDILKFQDMILDIAFMNDGSIEILDMDELIFNLDEKNIDYELFRKIVEKTFGFLAELFSKDLPDALKEALNNLKIYPESIYAFRSIFNPLAQSYRVLGKVNKNRFVNFLKQKYGDSAKWLLE